MFKKLASNISHHFSLCIVLCSLAIDANSQESLPVRVITAQQQPVYRQVDITGTVTSPRVAQLSTAISGLILTMAVDIGDRVDAGTPLLELDPELAELELKSAEAQVAQAKTALADARRRLREAQSLGSQRGIAETLIRGLEAEVSQGEARLDEIHAQAQHHRALLARHQLKAPFSGVISKKFRELGEWVTPGTAVFELVDSDHPRLDFAVAEDYLAALTPKTKVNFTLNALPGRHFRGQVSTIVPITEPGARTFLLRVAADNPDPQMIPGMSARATLIIASGRNGLVVPRDALLRYPDGRVVVWTVRKSKEGLTAQEKRVVTGEAFDGLVEIHEGLEPEMRVVVKGNEALQNGQSVRVVSDSGDD
ncbi:MAG: efflux RND transporter periplasmic adaptor subunit [Porticoccaceae bacterium]|nr:efflux RND transporter periplasmic adaptor subunit [Porticoccaceae bacterium]